MSTISLCMIVRDSEHCLGRCLKSVRQYVDEIVIVDTGSTDGTKIIAAAYGARIFDYTERTHPDSFLVDDETTGAPPPYTQRKFLADFAGARNYGFDRATKDYVLWLDSDDVLDGADSLRAIVADMESHSYAAGWLLYDYAFSPEGKPNCQLWRERIIKRSENARWQNRVHEILILDPAATSRYYHGPKVVHRRDSTASPGVAHRNYKILRKVLAAEELSAAFDARTLFYLGNETRFINPEEAASYYERYLRCSGWPTERAVARILLGQLYEHLGRREDAFKAYSSAVADDLSNPDGWMNLGRLSYFKGEWDRCVEYYERGLALGNPTSPIMYNPLERTYYPHEYYNVALNNVGRVKDALASCEAGLAVNPTNANLLYNKAKYEEFIRTTTLPPRHIECILDMTREGAMSSAPKLPDSTTAILAVHVWKELLRYDEVCKAREYLDALPYVIQDDASIKQARRITEELLEFTKTPSALRDYYSTHKVDEAVPLDFEFSPDSFYGMYLRWTTIQEYLPPGKLRILDIGCQDGWISNRLAMLGHSVVGVDFSKGHLAIAERNATAKNLNAAFVEGFIEDYASWPISGQFDVVLCTEVIEHIDNYRVLLSAARTYCKPQGTFILSTPRGAWLGGKSDEMPWGYKWNEKREHIRAWTPDTIRDAVSEFFDVSDVSSRLVPTRPDVEGQAIMFVKATPTVPAEVSTSLDIVFYLGSSPEWWSPDSIKTTGIGGSELAAVHLAKELAKRGNRVRVFSDCPHMDGLYDRVEYSHYGKLDSSLTCDVFISSRQPAIAEHRPTSKVRMLWVHDIHFGSPHAALYRWFLWFDRVVCLSQWHKDECFTRTYPDLNPDVVTVLRNAIDPCRFSTVSLEPRANKLIYSSSPNRGLAKLLALFPRILKNVPDTELHVYYGFQTWEKYARMFNSTKELDEISQYKSLLSNAPGVTFHGRVNQEDLAAAFMSSKVWAYPTNFTETSCITAMEAQAAGCVPVTSSLAALNETVASGASIDPSDPCYDDKFVSAVSLFLKDNSLWQQEARIAREFGSMLSWSLRAEEWLSMIRELLASNNVAPRFYEGST